jgi:hypothetical protein
MKLKSAEVMELIVPHRHQSGMLDQLIADQKNVPPTLEIIQEQKKLIED